jgi:aminobenzoyl-glutamate utilization protein B
MTTKFLSTLALLLGVSLVTVAQKKFSPKQIEALKTEVALIVEANHKQSQVMVDKSSVLRSWASKKLNLPST